MNPPFQDNRWEDRLRAGLGEPAPPDFEAWRARHADAKPALEPLSIPRWPQYRSLAMTSLKWAAASLVFAVGLFLFRSDGTLDRQAFAGSIPGVDDAKTMTWTTTTYVRVLSRDRKRTWLEEVRRLHAYRHPGHYRETALDKSGQPSRVEITDVRAGRMLALDLKNKKAVLKSPWGQPDVRGPFSWVGDALRDRTVAKTLPVKSVSLRGRKEIDKIEANVIRVMIDHGGQHGLTRRDFLFDVQSKRLVAIWHPNENDFDLETAPERNQPAEKESSSHTPVAYWEHEIVLDAKLDATDFSLDPPAGYAFEAIARPITTEEEMVAFLGAAARYNDGVFPDSPLVLPDGTKFSATLKKDAAERTPEEQELVRFRDKSLNRGEVYRSPVLRFVEENTEPGSFHYVGAGAKVGQGGQILCWFKTRGTTKQRAVFADLSVRDVTPAELPLGPEIVP